MSLLEVIFMALLKDLRKQVDVLDRKTTELFNQRMALVKEISALKEKENIDITDVKREEEILKQNTNYVESGCKPYFKPYFTSLIDAAKRYQADLRSSSSVLITGKTEVIIEKGIIGKICRYLPSDCKILVLTDSGVPSAVLDVVFGMIKHPFLYVVKKGDKSKSLRNFERINKYLIKEKFTRNDAVLAVGGGMISDLGGYVASSYMRGISLYLVPTTLLAMLDASVGGKTAVNCKGIKNIIGSFYPARNVFVDPFVLRYLPPRIFAEGMAEAIKIACVADASLFKMLYDADIIEDDITEVIRRCILAKKKAVEDDFYDYGARGILNFGHTVGHAIEALGKYKKYLHGEAVAIGMTYFTGADIKKDLLFLLKKYHLPFKQEYPKRKIYMKLLHDKKRSGNKITVCCVDTIGKGRMEELTLSDIMKRIN